MYEIYTMNVYNNGDLKGYADGTIEMKNDGYHYEFLYRVEDDPENGPANTMVSIDCGYCNEKIAELWDRICESVQQMIYGYFKCSCGATIIDPHASNLEISCYCGRSASKVKIMSDQEVEKIKEIWFGTPIER